MWQNKGEEKKRAEHEQPNVPDPVVNHALHIGLTQIHSNEKASNLVNQSMAHILFAYLLF